MPITSSAITGAEVTAALVALLRGGAAPVGIERVPAWAVREAASREGVAGLIAALPENGATLAAIQQVLSADARRLAVIDLLREPELVELLAALTRAGVRPLVFKGAQLAYTCYDRPEHRPRLDSDILIPPDQRDLAIEVLKSIGCDRVPQLDADLISYQMSWIKRRDSEIVHAVDLHWRIANPQRFGRALAFEELDAGATPIPALGEDARGLGPVHALLVSLLHAVAHHQHAARLIWDVDTTRLAARLREADWSLFTTLAVDRRLSDVCVVGLERACRLFSAAVPPDVMRTLRANSSALGRARTGGARPGRHVVSVIADVRALAGWRDRVRLVRQHLLPPSEYMRRVYRPDSRAPLPALHAHRIAHGALKWMRRPRVAR